MKTPTENVHLYIDDLLVSSYHSKKESTRILFYITYKSTHAIGLCIISHQNRTHLHTSRNQHILFPPTFVTNYFGQILHD